MFLLVSFSSYIVTTSHSLMPRRFSSCHRNDQGSLIRPLEAPHYILLSATYSGYATSKRFSWTRFLEVVFEMSNLPSSHDHQNNSIPHLSGSRLVFLSFIGGDVPYNTLTKSGAEPELRLGAILNNVLQNKAHFMWLLDAHNSDHAAGVPENIFKSIFYVCSQCGRYMTRRVSGDHYEDADLDDKADTICVNLRLAKEAGNHAEKNSFRVVAQDFPVLLPLAQ